MTTLLDTSAVIALIERRDPAVVELVRQLDGPSVRSMVVYGELLHGLALHAPGIVERRRLDQNDRWIIAGASILGIEVFVTQDSTQGRLAAQWFAEAGIEVTVHIAGA